MQLNVTEVEELLNYTCSSGVSRQMPNTVASQNYDKSTEQVSFIMIMSTIYTLALSLLLSNAIKKLLVTLFSLQIIIHMFLFTIPFPGNIVNVIKKIKPLVSFNILKDLNIFIEKVFIFDSLQ